MAADRWLLVALSAVLAVGYVWGLWLNRRKSRAAYRWLRQGLRAVWGREPQGAWLGSMATGARLQLRGAPPFRHLEVAFLLQTRELLPLWLFNRLRGKGDDLVIRAQLRGGVPVEWELRPAGHLLPRLEGFRAVEVAPGWQGWMAPPEAQPRPNWSKLLDRYGPALRAISLRRGRPHLIVRADLSRLMAMGPAAEFFAALRGLWQAESASQEAA
ncbi:MAG: hypothetical protein GXO54_05780 [Chloroflexi bacterium]|nr:hypothetical protein [Chloroflexota bacterium]